MTPEAKARGIAERHGWDRVRECRYDIALIEALHFQPLPEWSETMDSKCFCRTLDPTRQPCLVCVQNRRKSTPTKPDELPGWARLEAVDLLNAERARKGMKPNYTFDMHDFYDVRTVARLLVRIKELDGPKEDPDLVLAREVAADTLEEDNAWLAGRIRKSVEDNNLIVQSALRTIKHLRDAGWKEG